MTLLNTLANLGGTWVGTLALWLVDVISFKDCMGVTDASLDCDTMAELQACQAAGGNCVTHIDGYYIQMVVCLCLGVIWYVWQRKRITKLQNLDRTSWHVTNTDTINH
jgi:PAT family acetyl-CoA transporter-like MFS transporter 1